MLYLLIFFSCFNHRHCFCRFHVVEKLFSSSWPRTLFIAAMHLSLFWHQYTSFSLATADWGDRSLDPQPVFILWCEILYESLLLSCMKISRAGITCVSFDTTVAMRLCRCHEIYKSIGVLKESVWDATSSFPRSFLVSLKIKSLLTTLVLFIFILAWVMYLHYRSLICRHQLQS